MKSKELPPQPERSIAERRLVIESDDFRQLPEVSEIATIMFVDFLQLEEYEGKARAEGSITTVYNLAVDQENAANSGEVRDWEFVNEALVNYKRVMKMIDLELDGFISK